MSDNFNRVLVTGFDAYGGRTDNPSAEIAKRLAGKTIAGVEVHCSIFPVVNSGLQSRLERVITANKPSAIIALGLCPGEGLIRLERLAANYSNFEIPDNSGERVTGLVIDGAPAAFETTLPLAKIQSNLIASGIPARQSNSAGTYLCNALMFSALHYCFEHLPECLCGFVHLPLLPSQVCDLLITDDSAVDPYHQTSIASMPIEMQLQAIEVVIKSIVPGSHSGKH